MDKQQVLELARQAGFTVDESGCVSDGIETAQDVYDELARFAELVAKAERERAAEVDRDARARGLERLIRERAAMGLSLSDL